MKTLITKFPINNELDIVLAHKRTIQLCELTGISISDKTRFATAISEICRNCLEYAKNGDILFSIDEINNQYSLESIIEDKGPGIKNLEEILSRKNININTRGVGILHSRKLVDYFNIHSSSTGTLVSLGVKVPVKHPPINNIIIKGWSQHFERSIPVSPYEEIKKQNMQLIEVTEQLKLKNLQAENQIGEIKTLNHQLKKANKELEDFAFAISHDIKSPINNIELIISLLKKSENDEKNKFYVSAIDTSIHKLKSTINGLIEIIETQNSDISIKDISFNQLFLNIKEQYQSEINTSSADLITRFDYESVKYYEAHLYSIMQNLISNAIKYRDEEKATTIEVITRKEEKFCVLEIKDNGIGMNLNKIGNNIFKPFTRFNKNKEGNGIGLHLVKSMVERNGGRIEVESIEGKGSTFRVFLMEY